MFALPNKASTPLPALISSCILAKPLGISKVDASSEAIQIQFVPNPPIDPMKVITMIQSKRHIKMAGPDKLKIDLKYGDLQQRVLAVKNFFGELK